MPAILGEDFLSKHAATLVFDQSLVYVHIGKEIIHTVDCKQDKTNLCCAVSTRSDPDENNAVDECAVPRFDEEPAYNFPSCSSELHAVFDEYR